MRKTRTLLRKSTIEDLDRAGVSITSLKTAMDSRRPLLPSPPSPISLYSVSDDTKITNSTLQSHHSTRKDQSSRELVKTYNVNLPIKEVYPFATQVALPTWVRDLQR